MVPIFIKTRDSETPGFNDSVYTVSHHIHLRGESSSGNLSQQESGRHGPTMRPHLRDLGYIPPWNNARMATRFQWSRYVLLLINASLRYDYERIRKRHYTKLSTAFSVLITLKLLDDTANEPKHLQIVAENNATIYLALTISFCCCGQSHWLHPCVTGNFLNLWSLIWFRSRGKRKK